MADEHVVVDERLFYVIKELERSLRDSSKHISTGVDHLANVMQEAAEGSDKVGRQLVWLNVVLTAATVVGAVGAILAAVAAFK